MEAESKKTMNEVKLQYNKEVEALKCRIQENSQMILNRSFSTFPVKKSAVVINETRSAAFLEPDSQRITILNCNANVPHAM